MILSGNHFLSVSKGLLYQKFITYLDSIMWWGIKKSILKWFKGNGYPFRGDNCQTAFLLVKQDLKAPYPSKKHILLFNKGLID